MSLSIQERNDVVLYRIEKAHTTLEQAKNIIPMHYWEVIANRLYYAAYYAVSALLIAHELIAKSHDGTIRLFGLHFVKEHIVPAEMGKHFRQLFKLRLTGDYSDRYDLTEEDVLPLVEPTEQLIETVSALAKQAIEQ